ncbi:hypothetical protein E4P42_23885 [Mycobacterium sp. PS03-16]|uniref:hypothetical protein n=1 Tax=Mycobacterium sp. PS03-16 TaxID=2559611 RepID=UPI0010740069|nr:hypothetical protein [Mycobacterium sp. PS03-16]TFV55111.1 hypothetical protein E4P42_23885 [Mycobacterium sp. PS03-16]
MQHTGRRLLPTLLVLSAVALLAGCSLANDILGRNGTTTADSPQAALPVPADGDSRGDMPSAPEGAGQPGALTVTVPQRRYLDALSAAGVRPSSDLRALSIGSAVCQAHAAKHGAQAMWDFIMPLVRSDLRATRPSSMRTTAGEISAATGDYIRIATERLC